MTRRAAMTGIIGLHAALTMACALPGPARADRDPAGQALNRVSFQVERTRKVANDRATATVGVSLEDSDAGRLADRVNEAMRWALEKAREVDSVEARSGSYRTHPVYEDERIRRWRASQDLILESGDVKALSLLIGDLQSRLVVRQVAFGVSPERRRSLQEELITETLEAYRRRALGIQKALSARGFALVELTIETSPGSGPRLARAQALSSESAPPAFEAGRSELSVRVQATIELED